MRLSIFIATIMLILAGKPSQAQYWEYGGWAGISNYFGDLNSNTSFAFLGPGAGLFAKYNTGTRFAVETGFNFGIISATDEVSKDPFISARNLSFRSILVEWNSQIEFNFLTYKREEPEKAFTPYILTGFSVFYFNPKAYYNGEWHALQPLGTEGQNFTDTTGRKPYSRIGFAIPIGGGFKYSFLPQWAIHIEVGIRKTFTDYLDDVSTTYADPSLFASNSLASELSDRSDEVGDAIGSAGRQRGLSEKKDDFVFMGVGISYTIIKVRCPKPSTIW